MDSIARVAVMLREAAPLFKFLLPGLLLVGGAAFAYHGFRGIVHRRTIILGRMRLGGNRFGEVEGAGAIALGVAYWAIVPLLGVFLGPLSYYMWMAP